MREILFRGKRIDNGEWVYGYYARKGADKESFRHYICVSTFIPDYQSNYTYPFYLYDYEVDPITVGQYTGLTANGKKIFEGDIVEFYTSLKKYYAKVYYKKGMWSLYIKGFNDRYMLSVVVENDYSVKVVGNIHDNPELLEDKP